MSIDKYLDRMPTKNYRCFDFVNEVWRDLTGKDAIQQFLNRKFVRLAGPVSPCVVAMQKRDTTPHVGIFIDGRILHLRDYGVEYQPLVVARSFYTRIKYYA
jgi:hypothetical protein